MTLLGYVKICKGLFKRSVKVRLKGRVSYSRLPYRLSINKIAHASPLPIAEALIPKRGDRFHVLICNLQRSSSNEK